MLRAGAQPNINAKEYSSLEVPLPSIKEQQKIVNILELNDMSVSLLTVHVEKLQQQKKGLMQQLLTGQVRVKVGAE